MKEKEAIINPSVFLTVLYGGKEQLLRFMAIRLHEGVESNGLEPPIH